jgi:mono/diheme cytochrome c family protein
MKNLFGGIFSGLLLLGLLVLDAAAAEVANFGDSKVIEAGRRLFIEKQCAHCHGSDGKGGVNLADRDIDPARAFETIANGRVSGNARMPAWRDLLSDDEIREAIAYVMSLSNTAK